MNEAKTLAWFPPDPVDVDYGEFKARRARRRAFLKSWSTLSKIQKRRDALEHVELGGESGE